MMTMEQKKLAKILRRNETLKNLHLCNKYEDQYRNSIGDKGATALAGVLKQYNSSIRKLHLCGNTSITDKGFRKLTKTVQRNKTLKLYIDLPGQISMTLDKETMERIKPACTTKNLSKLCTVEYL